MKVSRLILAFLTFPVSLLAIGQHRYDSLSQLGWKSMEDSQYAKAIDYFSLAINATTDEEQKFVCLSLTGDCYFSTGNLEKAKRYYSASIRQAHYDVMFQEFRLSEKLAQLYINDGEFDSALHYLNYTTKLPQLRTVCDDGIKLQTDHHFLMMKCFEGLSKFDAAIRVFAPYAFREQLGLDRIDVNNEHQLENDYHCQILAFIDLLKRKYSACDLHEEIKKAISNATVTEWPTHYDTEYQVILSLFGKSYAFGNIYYRSQGWEENFREIQSELKNSTILHLVNSTSNF